MFSCDHLSHPSQQDAGTGQGDRMPGNLSGSTAPIDGRQVSDLLNYFSGLAGQIKFYNDDGSTSDWRSFFQNHLPFQLSQIDTFTGDKIKSGMEAALRLFYRNPSANGLQLLFLQTYYTAIYPLQQWSILLPVQQDISIKLTKLIKDRLQSPVQSFISWLNTAVHCWGIQAPDLTVLSGNPAWGLTPAMLSAYQKDFSCSVKSTRSQLLEVQAALSDMVNAFADVIDMTVDGVAGLVNKNLYTLLQNNGQANTPPQLAVLYVFLFQYQKVLKDLNGLTDKQLNFFFQQVLSLSPGASIPDQAYVVFTIQKQLPVYTIAAATTSLKAGKDSKGADIYFQLNADLTVNQTQVAAVQTVFVNKQPLGSNTYIEGVYMVPNAQMADGLTKPFTGTAAWPSLGAKKSLYTPPGAAAPVDYPMARLGFVLASKVLFLKEGKRKIDIQLVCQWTPGKEGCSDGMPFQNLFCLAKESVCASFVVLTPAIMTQALQAGVSQQTIAALLNKYLLDNSANTNPCTGAQTVYLDKYILWIPCCSDETPTWNDGEAAGKKQEGGERVEAFELEGAESPIKLDASQRCPGEWEEVRCAQSAQLALQTELGNIAGGQTGDVTILMELLPLQNLFDVEFSGEKGWQAPDFLDMRLELPTAAASITDSSTTGTATSTATAPQTFIWHIYATIDSGSPGIVFYDKTKMGEDLHVTDPVVKIQLNNDITWAVNGATVPATSSCLQEPAVVYDQNVSPYEFFRNVALLVSAGDSVQKTKIDVTVCGVKNLVVQNDANLMDVTKAFTPFGPKPLIPDFELTDTGFQPGVVPGPNFYIGSQEVLLKKWTELYLNMSWLSKPIDFDDYYRSYLPEHYYVLHIAVHPHLNPGLQNNYKVKLAVLENGLWHDWRGPYSALFPGPWESFPICCDNVFDDTFPMRPHDFTDPVQVYDPDFAPIMKWVAGMQRGFLRMTLENQDFLHKYYPWVMGRAMRSPNEYPNVINEPWTPTILPGMSIDYKATAWPEDMELVQLYPFDGTSAAVNIYGTPTLMANFCNEGNLFIGLTGLVPGQSLNVLFELAEATAASGSAGATLCWKYLTGNEWKPLRSGFELVTDGTSGLTRTGIIQFVFPDDIDSTSTVLPTGMFWITAELNYGTTATSRTIAIITQAGIATYAPVANVNDANRSATPLPANSITKLTQPDANVIKIAQPYPSFGGSAPENSGNAYVVRVSEGLRHKGRAIQQWDYERLVLQQFPMLSRVKCINHSYYLDDASYKYDFPMSPGNILVAVLPDTNQLSVADELQPTVPTSLLTDIGTFLQGLKSPFVNVTVANPRYEPVTICLTVRFKKNENVVARSSQLEDAIEALLAPWLGGNMAKFKFAQPLNFAAIANLVQQQDYVAHLTQLTISHAGEQAAAGQQQSFIAPRTPRSILVAGNIFVNPEK